MVEITVHLYCSYNLNGIPQAGFQHGFFVWNSADSRVVDYVLTEDKESKENSIVQTAFEEGLIKKIKGFYKDRYWFLVKSLLFDSSDETCTSDVNINISFEFKDQKLFKRFAEAFDHEQTDKLGEYNLSIRKALADCISIKKEENNLFGYVIDRQKFDSFMRTMTEEKTPLENSNIERNLEITSVDIVAKYQKKDYSGYFKSQFGFDEMPERKENSPVYIFGKKKLSKEAVMSAAQNLPALLNKMPKKMLIPVAIVIVVIALAINTWLGIAVIAALAAARKFLTKPKEK